MSRSRFCFFNQQKEKEHESQREVLLQTQMDAEKNNEHANDHSYYFQIETDNAKNKGKKEKKELRVHRLIDWQWAQDLEPKELRKELNEVKKEVLTQLSNDLRFSFICVAGQNMSIIPKSSTYHKQYDKPYKGLLRPEEVEEVYNHVIYGKKTNLISP